MYNIQSNAARLIYTLSDTKPTSDIIFCKLKNGFYFKKEARSDEKLQFTERDMFSIIRTILFMYVFKCSPLESYSEIIYLNKLTLNEINPNDINDLTLSDIIILLDKLFGENFCRVINRHINIIYNEYKMYWRYSKFDTHILALSPLDIKKLNSFVNTPISSFTAATKFIAENKAINIHLQGKIKKLG